MISVIPNGIDSILEVTIDGKIDAQDMEEFKAEFHQKRGEHDKLNLLLVVHDLKGQSLQAVAEDLKFEANHWDEFGKIAIISDKKWIEVTSKISGYLAKLEVKHFDVAERAEAEHWLLH
ncbi:STAS/SEC14 domain-containing protein [Radiobacillus sp. PE A8.2]|uniref:STAS/SEC14 domain-containing protein n=1 Tax=Radiobacillus sp. PE A8.2 TaxID=3380349 RepID=UPI00388CF5DB